MLYLYSLRIHSPYIFTNAVFPSSPAKSAIDMFLTMLLLFPPSRVISILSSSSIELSDGDTNEYIVSSEEDAK